LVQEGKVTGLAVAVFNNNRPVYQKTFGYKNAASKKASSEHEFLRRLAQQSRVCRAGAEAGRRRRVGLGQTFATVPAETDLGIHAAEKVA
jgi:hypothetical protein